MASTPIPSFANGYAPRDGPPEYPQPPQGLVGCWSGVVGKQGKNRADLSGNHHTGVMTSFADINAAEVPGNPKSGGYALNFDDTEGNYVDIGSIPVLKANTPFSLLWWECINADTDTFPSRFRLKIENGSSTEFLVIRSSHANYKDLAWGVSGLSRPRMDGGSPISSNVGTWRHFALVGLVGPESGSAADYLCYVDGKSKAVTLGSQFIITGNVKNRFGYDNNDNGANAKFNSWSIYDRAVSSNEIQHQFERPNDMFTLRRRVFPAAVAAAGGIVVLRRRMEAA